VCRTVFTLRFQVPPQNLQIPLIRALILHGERYFCEIRATLILLQIKKVNERLPEALRCHQKESEWRRINYPTAAHRCPRDFRPTDSRRVLFRGWARKPAYVSRYAGGWHSLQWLHKSDELHAWAVACCVQLIRDTVLWWEAAEREWAWGWYIETDTAWGGRHGWWMWLFQNVRRCRG